MKKYNVSKECLAFPEDSTDFHKEHRTGRLPMITDGFLRWSEEEIRAKMSLKIGELHNIIAEETTTTLHKLKLKCGFDDKL